MKTAAAENFPAPAGTHQELREMTTNSLSMHHKNRYNKSDAYLPEMLCHDSRRR